MKKPNSLPEDDLTPLRKRIHAKTRKDLWEALDRLRSGKTTVVPIGTRISAKSVAEEAGVDRATLYRSHTIVLDEIRIKTAQTLGSESAPKIKPTTDLRLAEYKSLAEEAQTQVALLARNQYELGFQIEELKRVIEVKESVIHELNERLAKLSAERRLHSIK